MASTGIRLLPIFPTLGVLRILKKRLSIVYKQHYSYLIHLLHDLVYQRIYQEQFDIILIEKKSESRQWRTYTDLRIHLFDPSLFHLLSFCFLSNILANNV